MIERELIDKMFPLKQVYFINVKSGILARAEANFISHEWILCDGRTILRRKYKKLFNLIGTTFGIGDGTTTFNIPNLLEIKKDKNTN